MHTWPDGTYMVACDACPSPLDFPADSWAEAVRDWNDEMADGQGAPDSDGAFEREYNARVLNTGLRDRPAGGYAMIELCRVGLL